MISLSDHHICVNVCVAWIGKWNHGNDDDIFTYLYHLAKTQYWKYLTLGTLKKQKIYMLQDIISFNKI